jgi:fermentation-respiration switch protein FrsA (DUF1100 family)
MSVVLGIGAGLVAAAVLVRLFENRFIYFPPRFPEGFPSPESYGLKVEEVWLTAEDGVRLNAWYLPNTSSSKVLLVFHGNAENLGYSLPRLRYLARLGTSLLAVDYRGYGRSEGAPNEAGIYRDALGSAVAIELASRHECGGLIVESAFTSARELARRMFRIPFFEYLPKSRFDSLAKIARVQASVLVIHGSRDQVFPSSMAERLYRAAPGAKSFLLVEGAGHDDVFLTGGEHYLNAIGSVIDLRQGTPPA